MQLFTDVKDKVAEFASDNATTLLTAGGVVGVVGTAILSGRAGFKLGTTKRDQQREIHSDLVNGPSADEFQDLAVEDVEILKKNLIVAAIPELIPPVITGTATITAIIMANRMSAQKAAALAAAYGLAERNFADYKTKVEEKLTGPKKQQIDDELAQESVSRTPGSDKIVFVEGEVLCFEKPGGRYFNGTVERIRQAMNVTNSEVHKEGFVPLSFFYEELGLDGTKWADEVGFNREHLLDLTFTTTLAPGNRPCVVFDFVRYPKGEFDYDPKYT